MSQKGQDYGAPNADHLLALPPAPAQIEEIVDQKRREAHEDVRADPEPEPEPEPELAPQPAAGANASFVNLCSGLGMPEQAICSWIFDAPAAPPSFCISFFVAILIETVRKDPSLGGACFLGWRTLMRALVRCLVCMRGTN